MRLVMQVDYLQQDKAGTWYYRRRVPRKLLTVIGKQEIVRSLRTKDRAVALRRYGAVHENAESELAKAGALPFDRLIHEQTMADLKAAGLIEQTADGMDKVPGDYTAKLDQFLAAADAVPKEAADGPFNLLANPALRILHAAVMGVEQPQHRLSEVVEHYVLVTTDKFNEDDVAKQAEMAQAAIRKATGEPDPTLAEISHEVAEKVRDAMLARGNKPSSVRRRTNTMRAMFNHFIKAKRLSREFDNPFKGLAIPKTYGGTAKDERNALTVAEIEACTAKFATSNDDLRDIWSLQVFTGARPSEIRALPWEDVQLDHETPHIILRFSDERRVKGETSVRSVPLIGPALEIIRSRSEARSDNHVWVFPRYGKKGGMNSMSQAQIKRMKAAGVWVHTKKVPYSTRHSMADWLRRYAGEDWAAAVLGHKRPGQTGTYGDDQLLDIKATHMTKALRASGMWGTNVPTTGNSP